MTVIYTLEFTQQVADQEEVDQILKATSSEALKEVAMHKIEKLLNKQMVANVVCTKIQVFPEIENE